MAEAVEVHEDCEIAHESGHLSAVCEACRPILWPLHNPRARATLTAAERKRLGRFAMVGHEDPLCREVEKIIANRVLRPEVSS